MSQFTLKIVTPENQIFDAPIDMLTAPTLNGEIGILPHHANLMVRLSPGELKLKQGSKIQHLAIGDGFLQVIDNQAIIMTDLAQDADQIDEKAVEEAKKRAEQALEEKLSAEEYAETLAILEKSLAQLKVKRRHRVR